MIITFLISQQNNISGSVDALTDYVNDTVSRNIPRRRGILDFSDSGTAGNGDGGRTPGTRNGLSREISGGNDTKYSERRGLAGEALPHVLLSQGKTGIDETQRGRRLLTASVCLHFTTWMHSRSTHISARFWTYTTKRIPEPQISRTSGNHAAVYFYYELTGAADIHRTGNEETDYGICCKKSSQMFWQHSTRQREHPLLLAALVMCVYMLGRKQGSRSVVRAWIRQFRTAAGSGNIFSLVFYVSMMLFRTLLCRTIWGNPLDHVLGIWVIIMESFCIKSHQQPFMVSGYVFH